MALKTVEIGAPSGAKDAFQIVETAFKHANFPLKVRVQNLLPFAVTFPEVGCFLKTVFDATNSVGEVTVSSYDALQRFAASIVQIAVLNKAPAAARLSAEVKRPYTKRAEPEAVEATEQESAPTETTEEKEKE